VCAALPPSLPSLSYKNSVENRLRNQDRLHIATTHPPMRGSSWARGLNRMAAHVHVEHPSSCSALSAAHTDGIAAWLVSRVQPPPAVSHLSNAGLDRWTCNATSVSAVCVSWRAAGRLLGSAARVPCSATHRHSATTRPVRRIGRPLTTRTHAHAMSGVLLGHHTVEGGVMAEVPPPP
jgi:hypothetical protein